MKSLSDSVGTYVENQRELFNYHNTEADVKLDPRLPPIYDENQEQTIHQTLDRLLQEAQASGASRLQYETFEKDGDGLLIILRDGSTIPSKELDGLNAEAKKIAKGRDEAPSEHSLLVAAQLIKVLGGELRFHQSAIDRYNLQIHMYLPFVNPEAK